MVSSESSDMARPSGRPRKWLRLARPRYNSRDMPPRSEAVSVILPVLNERDNLEPLHERLTAALKPLGRDYEIVFVADGRTDRSWGVMKRLVASDRAVRLVRLRRNFGQTAALAAGLAHSRHPVIVTLDADLQNDPADIPRLLAVLDAGDDVVCGWRRARQDRWLTRRFPSILANRLIRWITGVRMHDMGCTLRAYRRDVLADVHLYGDMHRYLPVLVGWVGGRMGEIGVAHHRRAAATPEDGLLRVFRVVVEFLSIQVLGDSA